MDSSDSLRQALTQCPVWLMRQSTGRRKSHAPGTPVSPCREEVSSRTSRALSPPARNYGGTGSPVQSSLREERVPGARLFALPSRSLSPTGSEARSYYFAEPPARRAVSPDERNTKLRGDGHNNFRRNIASPGIHWRQVPNLDRPNSACAPRDGEGAERLRKQGQFTPKLGAGEGMRDILGSLGESHLVRTPPLSRGQQGEAGSNLAQRRPDSKPATACGRRLDFGEHEGRDSVGGDKASPHFAYKQQKKGVNHELVSLKESCPFHRLDAPAAPEDGSECCTPKPRRRSISPPANLSGAVPVAKGRLEDSVTEELTIMPEKVTESRRDWQGSGIAGRRSPQGLRIPVGLLSPVLSPRAVLAFEKPIHPIRQRNSLKGGERWK